MIETDLQLVSTKDLSIELCKRFDAVVIYGVQKNLKANGISNYYDHFVGEFATLIGLCELMQDKFKQEFRIGERDANEA